jgi:hypothetical protein
MGKGEGKGEGKGDFGNSNYRSSGDGSGAEALCCLGFMFLWCGWEIMLLLHHLL